MVPKLRPRNRDCQSRIGSFGPCRRPFPSQHDQHDSGYNSGLTDRTVRQTLARQLRLASFRGLGKPTFSSLNVRNYRLYLIGQCLSQSGTWMQSIAQALLVLDLTGSGTDLGVIIALQSLPMLLAGPWGGVVADRFPKRLVLYLTQTAFALQALVLGVLVATDVARVWMVGVLALVYGCIRVIDSPTRQAFVMEMVGRDQLQNAVSLNSTLMSLARIIGPTVAGVLVATIGLAGCFLVNAGSYLLVVLALLLMHSDEFYASPRARKVRGQMAAGWSYAKSNHPVLIALLMMTLIGTFTYEFSVVLPLMATQTFHAGATGYAWMNALMGVGAVIGGLVVASSSKLSVKLLATIACGFGAAEMLTAFSPTLEIALVGMVFIGFMSVGFSSRGNATIQLFSAPEMRGRVLAFWMMAFIGSKPIGGPIVGWVGEQFGPRAAMGLGGVAAFLAGILGLIAVITLLDRDRPKAWPTEHSGAVARRGPTVHASK